MSPTLETIAEIAAPHAPAETPSQRGPWRSVAILFVALFALSLLVDPMSSLGSDVGGKTATMARLDQTHAVDIGYWAEAADPDGSLHPFYGTEHIGDQWVNATTFPMLLLAEPLYRVGGLHLAMLLPVAGAVLAATAARRLAQLLAGGDGQLAFWVIGLATPSLVYAMAFWEHTLGLGLMAWGVVFVMEAIGEQRWLSALVAGMAFGGAATMRQEALVYGFAAGVLLTVELLRRRRIGSTMVLGAAMVAGAVGVLAANTVLEIAVLGEEFRAARSGGAVSGAGTALSARVHDALLTTLAPSGVSTIDVVAGVITLVCLLVIFSSRRSPRDLMPYYVVPGLMFGVLLLESLVNGRSFIPSVLFTTPLAVAGYATWRSLAGARPILVFATLALPLVFGFQSTGALEAQWGGRYLLLTGWALVTVACAAAPTLPRPAFALGLAASVVMTSLGLVWTIERSHDLVAAFEGVAAVDAPVVIYDSPLLGREGSQITLSMHALAAAGREQRVEAVALLDTIDVDTFVFVSVEHGQDAPDFEGFRPVGTSSVPFLSGFDFTLTTFEKS